MITPYTCGRKYCPDCLLFWSSMLTAKTLRVVAKTDPMRLRHLTFTIPNAKEGGLHEALNILFRSLRDWRLEGSAAKKRKTPYWKPEGYAAKLEVHWSEKAGWHPHFHMLWTGVAAPRLRNGDAAREAWSNITARHGSRAGMGCGIYITGPRQWAKKHAAAGGNVDPVDFARGAALEVAKYAAKPVQLESLPDHIIEESAAAFTKRRFIASSGVLSLTENKGKADDWKMEGRLSRLVDLAMNPHTENQRRDRPQHLNTMEQFLALLPAPTHPDFQNLAPQWRKLVTELV
jgi:hypothetical protein